MSEDTEETTKQQMTRSGRSFGVGQLSGSGDLPSVFGRRPSSHTEHLASSPPVESEEMQFSHEMQLDSLRVAEPVRGPSPQRQEEEAASYNILDS